MSEHEDAIALANRVMDKPYIDPDGDICMLARQLLRTVELADKYKWQVRDTCTRAELAEKKRDCYGLALMMIREGARDPAGIARVALAKVPS